MIRSSHQMSLLPQESPGLATLGKVAVWLPLLLAWILPAGLHAQSTGDDIAPPYFTLPDGLGAERVVIQGYIEECQKARFENTPRCAGILPPGWAVGSAPEIRGGGTGVAGKSPAQGQAAKPASQSDTKTEKCAADSAPGSAPTTSGNPVLLTTGEKLLPQTDFSGGGFYAFDFTRTYRSRLVGNGAFGPKWASLADAWRITWSGQICEPGGPCAPKEAVLLDADGTQYKYTTPPGYVGEYNVNGSWETGALYYNFFNATWQLVRNGRTYNFSNAGVLTGEVSAGGRSLFGYTWSAGRLQTITSAGGATITLGWTSGRVTTVTDPAGKVWTYAYNANGMLASVTGPGSPADVRSYHYENASDPTLLTGVSINGVRKTSYAYDASKRVVQSGPVDGESTDTISYGTNSATVSSPKSPATTYGFTSVLGELRTTSMSRAAGVSCPNSAASTQYDANGYPLYADNWRGGRTSYS